VRDNQNRITALQVVTQRPRDLTRAELKALALELSRSGFSEASLRQAWREARNEDVAARIVGFIRQVALGDPLVPWAQRVQAAVARIQARGNWTEPQRKWLARIGKAVEDLGVANRSILDEGAFAD
jgi:type I restriction enzyme, R subunit